MATAEPPISSAPTPEQRETAALLRSVIGNVFADRFLDFCRLSNGAGTDLSLRATLPLAAHAMRELESILRQYLRTPFGASAELDEKAQETRQKTEAALKQLGHDANKIRNAMRELAAPKHGDEIKGICGKLGIAPDGEVAKAWLNLVNNQAALTHRRSSHELPVVGEEFRRDFARPFHMFVGEVALALQRHYSAYILAVDRLAAETDRVKAAKQFRETVPGTPPLQKRFYEKIEGAGWLAPLKAKGLLRAPVPNLDDQESGVIRWIEWAPALYLRRMAQSDDVSARTEVAAVLRELQDAEEFGLRDKCFEVATALPSAEAAGLSDVALEWLKPRWYWTLKAPEEYLKHLIKGQERAAVLLVARALFGISRNDAGVVSRYDRFDYEHSTPPFVEPITALCGLQALDLYCDLLEQAAVAKQFIKIDPPGDYSISSDPFADENKAKHDIYASVAWGTRRCAEQLIASDAVHVGAVIDRLVAGKYRIFLQLALQIAASHPKQLGGRARELLMRPDMVGQSWCAKSYGELARVAFGALDQLDQDAILREIDGMPERDGAIWARNVESMQGRAPTDEEMARIKLLVRRDIFWHWRQVLSPERQADIEQIVAEYGVPYGEDDRRFGWEGQRDESPISAADIVAKPVGELVAFLKGWKPGKDDEQLTESALGMELRNAVEFEPQRFAVAADEFVDIGPYYLLRILEGLDSQARNQKPFDWAPVLTLLAKIVSQAKAASPPVAAGDRDKAGWSWVLLTVVSLLRAGLIDGAGKIPLAHADAVWDLIQALWTAPAIIPDDFTNRLAQDPFFAGQATLRGSVLETAIRFGYWSGPREVAPEGQHHALPARVRALLDEALGLVDATDSGTSAIFGRYFDWLLFLDPAWLDANSEALLGAAASAQRKELVWAGHLLHGRSTLRSWEFFAPFAELEIERLGEPGYDNDWRGKQLTQLLMYFYYWDVIGLEANGLLARFLSRADAGLREHGVWSMMHDLNSPDLPQDKRDRLHVFYEARIDAAAASSDREAHRRELGMLGIWFGKNPAENGWMLQQLHRLAELKLTPAHPADFFTWLDSLLPEQTDEVIASLALVVEDDGFDRWMFAANGQQVRKILATGLVSPDPQTVRQAKQIANVLVAKGQSDLVDLAQ